MELETKNLAMCARFLLFSTSWWGWKELNFLPSGYEPPALTDELQPQ